MKPSERQGAEALPACAACGSAALQSSRQQQRFPYGEQDKQVELVAEVTVWKCKECGFELTDGEAEDARHEAVCRHLGMLTPTEIRQLRARYKLTQVQLAEYTGLGEASIKRWELGLNIQNRAADNLLRLMEDPHTFNKLRQMSSASGPGKSHPPPVSDTY